MIFSIPSFIYALSEGIPTGDSIFGEAAGPVFGVFRSSAPILITVINVVAMPALATFCSHRLQRCATGMLVFARAATTWIIPTLAILVFGNSCGKGWLGLWMQCADDALTQKMDVQGPSSAIELAEGNPICIDTSSFYQLKYFLKPTNVITGID